MATPLAILTIYGYIAFTALGSLAFLALAYRGYVRDTTVRTATPVHKPLREAA
jgi:hypothetical protein